MRSLCVVVLGLIMPAFAGGFAAETASIARFALWDDAVPFPGREELCYPDGAKDVMVHLGGADGYNFLHDSAIVEHKGVLLAAWYNCPQGEMAGQSLIRGRRSHDGGRTWSEVEVIASDRKQQGILYVPVACCRTAGRCTPS